MNKAIVTGASSGIGKAICRQLAANGWLVYGIGRSFNQSDDIAGIERIVCDITDTAKLIKTIKEINKNHDISLLINNAGVGFYALHEELNPVKISGTCGRLMCCLKYEQEAYSDLLKKTPKIGAYVSTPDGKGTVVDQNLIKGILNVQLQKNPDSPPKSYKVNEVKLIKDGQIKINKNEQEELKGLEG